MKQVNRATRRKQGTRYTYGWLARNANANTRTSGIRMAEEHRHTMATGQSQNRVLDADVHHHLGDSHGVEEDCSAAAAQRARNLDLLMLWSFGALSRPRSW